jgi:DNA-directed RNA polymerase specialized sigma24 family protein
MAIDNLEGGVAPVRPVVSRHPARAESTSPWLSFHDAQQTHLGSVHRFHLVALGSLAAAAPATRRALAAAGAAFSVDRPPPAAVSGWLLRIACRILREESHGRPPSPRRRGRSAAAEMGAEVTTALAVAAQLPDRERLAVALRCGAGLGYPEIGGILGITEEAARMACRWAAWSIRDRAAKSAG